MIQLFAPEYHATQVIKRLHVIMHPSKRASVTIDDKLKSIDQFARSTDCPKHLKHRLIDVVESVDHTDGYAKDTVAFLPKVLRVCNELSATCQALGSTAAPTHAASHRHHKRQKTEVPAQEDEAEVSTSSHAAELRERIASYLADVAGSELSNTIIFHTFDYSERLPEIWAAIWKVIASSKFLACNQAVLQERVLRCVPSLNEQHIRISQEEQRLLRYEDSVYRSDEESDLDDLEDLEKLEPQAVSCKQEKALLRLAGQPGLDAAVLLAAADAAKHADFVAVAAPSVIAKAASSALLSLCTPEAHDSELITLLRQALSGSFSAAVAVLPDVPPLLQFLECRLQEQPASRAAHAGLLACLLSVLTDRRYHSRTGNWKQPQDVQAAQAVAEQHQAAVQQATEALVTAALQLAGTTWQQPRCSRSLPAVPAPCLTGSSEDEACKFLCRSKVAVEVLSELIADITSSEQVCMRKHAADGNNDGNNYMSISISISVSVAPSTSAGVVFVPCCSIKST